MPMGVTRHISTRSHARQVSSRASIDLSCDHGWRQGVERISKHSHACISGAVVGSLQAVYLFDTIRLDNNGTTVYKAPFEPYARP